MDRFPKSPEHEPRQVVLEQLVALREGLGFVETEELIELRGNFVAAVEAEDEWASGEWRKAYKVAAQGLEERSKDTDIRLGILIAYGDLWLEAGSALECLEELQAAYIMADFTPGLEPEADQLQDLMQKLETLK